MQMAKIGILGASGYAGAELTRLTIVHPATESLFLSSVSFEGKTLDEVYPSLINIPRGGKPLVLESADAVIEGSDIVFSCLPHGHAESVARKCADTGRIFIDISADFRFGADIATFEKWYGKSVTQPDLYATAIYGLPELDRERICTARLIANPGCYPTSAELGLFPALKAGIADTSFLVIDSVSGVTGAGREPSPTTHYSEAADAFSPYKIGSHRHQPEIDTILSRMAGKEIRSVFTPHLAPMGRGIVSTIHFRFANGKALSVEDLYALYSNFYADEPFVRVLPLGKTASSRFVRFSNYCDISVHLSTDGESAIVISTIDNMVKGAAGQAVQNMNIVLGLDETTGLQMIPPAF
jgi:N-acetyl-gamma-glutamyl-phosphate reductase